MARRKRSKRRKTKIKRRKKNKREHVLLWNYREMPLAR